MNTFQPPHGYASAWKRFAAGMIDFCVYGAISIVAMIILGVPEAQSDTNSFLHPARLVAIVLFISYLVYLPSKNRQTLGMSAMKIEIVDYSGKNVSSTQAFLRIFAFILSVIPFQLGLVMIFFTKKRQTLHDKIVQTIVINKAK